jgi:hypothetical protein
MSVFEQKIEELKTLKENVERYKRERYDLEGVILEEGRKKLIKLLPELIWDVEFFDEYLLRLRLCGGAKFEEFMGILKEFKKLFNSTKLDLRINEYEFEIYYDGYQCKIVDVYVFDEKQKKYTHTARSQELMRVYGYYLVLKWDSLHDWFEKQIDGTEAAIRKLENRVLYLENLETCLFEAKESRKNEDRRG